MPKRLLYLSPQFPPNFKQFIYRLNDFGAEVLAIGSDSFWQLGDLLQRSLREYYQLGEMDNYHRLCEAARYLQEKHGAIDRVESHAEYWLPAEAAIREQLGIWGKNCAQTERIQKKSVMKLTFAQCGISVSRGMLACEEAWELAQECGYPLIAKPDRGVGAAATFKLHSADELRHFLAQPRFVPYFLEEFIEGDIFTFDGLTNHEGEVVYCNSLIYQRGIMETVNQDDDVYYYTAREIDPVLEKLGRRAVKAFDVREKFFHVEFFRRRGDGAYLGLEINIRPPGGFTVDMWNYADDIDLYREWARIIAEDRFTACFSRRYHVCYVSRKDRFSYRHSYDDVARRCGSTLCLTERIPQLFRNALGDSAFIVRSPHLEEVLSLAAFIHERA
jgi:hypothetical protein